MQQASAETLLSLEVARLPPETSPVAPLLVLDSVQPEEGPPLEVFSWLVCVGCVIIFKVASMLLFVVCVVLCRCVCVW